LSTVLIDEQRMLEVWNETLDPEKVIEWFKTLSGRQQIELMDAIKARADLYQQLNNGFVDTRNAIMNGILCDAGNIGA